jgi:hypothetical protein
MKHEVQGDIFLLRANNLHDGYLLVENNSINTRLLQVRRAYSAASERLIFENSIGISYVSWLK